MLFCIPNSGGPDPHLSKKQAKKTGGGETLKSFTLSMCMCVWGGSVGGLCVYVCVSVYLCVSLYVFVCAYKWTTAFV